MVEALTGRAASPGAAVGPAFVVTDTPPSPAEAEPGTSGEERDRLTAALETAAEQLTELAAQVDEAAGPDEAAIFEAHAAFAADPALTRRARQLVADGQPAEDATRAAFDAYRDVLAASDNDYLAARATDLDDVRDRVLRLLSGETGDAPVPEVASVVVGHELTPSRTATLPRELVVAIATETGSATSHAAILARSLGIPAVVGVRGLLEAVQPGQVVAVDGDDGVVVPDPDDATRARIEQRTEQARRRREALAGLVDEPGRTAEGRSVELAANIGGVDELTLATEAGAEGSGLVRTEFVFLDRDTAPSVDEQADVYREVLAAFPDQRVVFRTLDVGADKPLPFVDREAEPNPALGVRGIRLSLVERELFRSQLRGLLRASQDAQARLAIMFPMVCRVDELTAARALLDEVAAEEGVDASAIEIGAMLEVPAAVLAAGRLAAEADFLSLGTNDLLQYLFAADRLLDDVADLPDLFQPDVLRLIGDAIAAAHDRGAWVGVCGEAAGDVVTAAALVGLGVDELSMTPAAIPEIKDALRQVTADDLEKAVADAMTAPAAGDARARIQAVVAPPDHGPGSPPD